MNLSKVNWPKIVLFGDSLTQRSFDPNDGLWGALLANRLQRICDVINRGFSGYTSRQCKIVLPHLYSDKNISEIKAFVIFLGANDSCKEGSAQHVPLFEYGKNLTGIIKYLESVGLCKTNILLMTPPPYCHQKFSTYCSENGRPKPAKDNETVAEYVNECNKIGEECQVEVVDLYHAMNWQNFLIDGLHLSRTGSNFVYNFLWPSIEKRVDVSKMILPLWNEPVWK
ncbi:isoamyl acetate-hydrolyzing esterase 1 homolog isoform X2 [Uloborus diversus]|uniref:isoamyl acetate-hydrolyzing esterase 1 homolog isoform X2 n=1 Tax=Uloborus diversus TaxID=327109 RepID=UPI00240A37A8|nr:isoamyl acetate-hydrolyzing esterase 1 homolog isoform X2 [Uloborus diversus]